MATKDVLDRGATAQPRPQLKASAAQIRVIARVRLSETPPTRVPHPWRTRDETCASVAGRRSPAAGPTTIFFRPADDDPLPRSPFACTAAWTVAAETNTSNGAKSAPANTSTRANSRTPSPRWARNLAKHPELKPNPHLFLLGRMRVLDGDPAAMRAWVEDFR